MDSMCCFQRPVCRDWLKRTPAQTGIQRKDERHDHENLL